MSQSRAIGCKTRPVEICAALAAAVLFSALSFHYLSVTYDDVERVPRPLATVGSRDSAVFWRAYQCIRSGYNPYTSAYRDGHAPNARCEQGAPEFWNPPWSLSLLSPMLFGSIEVARVALLVFSLLSWLIAIALTWRVTRMPLLLAVVTGLVFAPPLPALSWGQLSLVLPLGAALFLWGVTARRDIAAGIGLSLLTIKPQAPYLLLGLALLWALKERRTVVLLSFAVVVSSLNIGSGILSPGSSARWLNFLPAISDYGASRATANLAGEVKRTLAHFAGFEARHAGLYVAGVTLAVSAFILVRRRSRVDWYRWTPHILCLSVLTSPYCWFYDHSLLLPVQVLTAAEAIRSDRRTVLWGLVGLQFAMMGRIFWSYDYLFEASWFPIVLWLLWERASQNNPTDAASAVNTT